MTFLTPALLLGAALVALPIVLHLARRREPRRLEFPALRLLEKTRKKQETHLRLRRLLLLALRCAAIALLALALARPILAPSTGSASAAAGSDEAAATLAIALVFDNAPNMGYRQAGQTRLDAAMDVAEWMIEQTPTDTQVVVAERTRGSRAQAADTGVALANLSRIRLAAATRSLDAAIADALQALDSIAAGQREVYVLTDLSAGAWTTATRQAVARILDDNTDLTVRLIDVGVVDPSNAGVHAIQLDADTLLRGEPLALEALVSVVGQPPPDAVIRLWIDDNEGQPIKRDERPLGDTTDASALRFVLAGLPEGTHTGRVQLVTADGLPADDARYFAVRVVSPPTIWLVAGSDSRAVFMREAVSATENVAGAECETLLISDFASDRQLARLNPSVVDAVLLLDPPPLRASVWRRLADYATAGGGVGVFLGGAASLDSLNDAGTQSVLPATFRWQSRDRTHLSPVDYYHTALSPLGPYAEALPWSAFPVLRRWEVERLGPDAEVAATYADGAPAIVSRRLGRGRVLLMTTPVSDPLTGSNRPWNLLPTGEDPWPFLLLAQSMTGYLASEPATSLAFEAGEPATVTLPTESPQASYLIQLPGGESIRQTAAPGAEELAIRLTEEPGVYRVGARTEGGVAESRFVVNLAENAGDIQRVSADKLVEDLGGERVEIVRDRRALASTIDRGRVGRELYGWVLALVIAAFAGEQVVSNRFYRRSSGGDEA